ncbi:MAG: transposase [Candidatus Eremiobacteraeota bacterium]|nr:transposase [Candidatus Eremiobacteraeota bacterium]
MNQNDWERAADDLALARYSVIAPLICRQLSKAELLRVKAEILASIHQFPDGKTRNVSRRTLDRWCEWYRSGHLSDDGETLSEPGIEALRPVRRLDQGSTRVLDQAIIERAVALRREEPSRNTNTLVELLKSEAKASGLQIPSIVEATLAYHLRHRKVTKRDLKKESRAFPRYEQPRRNVTWQGDWTQGFPILDPSSPNKPRLCHLHAFLDDQSRYIVHAEFYFRQNLPCLEDCFRKAIVSGGVPERVYWDNGAVYHSRQIKLIAARLKTEVIFATPYSPEGKGKIERWFRTVKEAFYPEARRAGIKSLADLNEFLWGWLEASYHTKLHSEIQCTPLARWEEGAGQARYPDPAGLVDLFLWEQQRQVDRSGCIQLAGNLYPVAEHLVGRKVTVRFDPFDLSRVRLYENGRFTQLLEPQTLTSRTFRKAVPKEKKPDSQLGSSAAFRDQMAKEFRERAGETVSRARGSANKNPRELMTVGEFCCCFQESLAGRSLTASDGKWLQDFYARNAPLAKPMVASALAKAVEAKGPNRHLRYYFDCIQAARLDEKRGA